VNGAPVSAVTAVAPGRVNLIGDHTDTTGGLVLPLAVDLVTTVTGRTGGTEVVLTSDTEAEPARVPSMWPTRPRPRPGGRATWPAWWPSCAHPWASPAP
jgi:galactokinase